MRLSLLKVVRSLGGRPRGRRARRKIQRAYLSAGQRGVTNL